jgi:hypothetical protein
MSRHRFVRASISLPMKQALLPLSFHPLPVHMHRHRGWLSVRENTGGGTEASTTVMKISTHGGWDSEFTIQVFSK